jgi:SAM-dependent methyltransferase
MGTDWDDLAEWWTEEVAGDPAYGEEVLPLLLDLLDPRSGGKYLDAGCGDGRVMRSVVDTGAIAIGCDTNPNLLRFAHAEGPVVGCRLPGLDWIRPGAFDGAYASLVAEHLADLPSFFHALAEAVRVGGPLVLVVNHPAFTAPGSGPIVDPTDGEVFWRWGAYLEDGFTEEPAGEETVTFFHRSFSSLLNSAASAEWVLEQIVERDVGCLADDDPLLSKQRGIPRLLGVRWRRSHARPWGQCEGRKPDDETANVNVRGRA